MRVEYLDEYLLYIDDPKWKVRSYDSNKTISLGAIFEAIDITEISNEERVYPIILEPSIVVAPKSLSIEFLAEHCEIQSWMDFKYPNKLANLSAVYEAYLYCGGVPFVIEPVNIPSDINIPSETQHYIDRIYHEEYVVRFFKEIEDAFAFVEKVYIKKLLSIFKDVERILDRQINLVGNVGWDIIYLQAYNRRY